MKKNYPIGIPVFLLFLVVNSFHANRIYANYSLITGTFLTRVTDSPLDKRFVFKDTCQTSMTLSSQAEVDAFPSVFHCNTICTLAVSGDDITNVDSLYVLTSIGDLTIFNNPHLSNLHGFANVTLVGGESCSHQGLYISGNPALSSLDGLSSLQRIDESLQIINNATLTTLDGLSALTSIGSIAPTSEGLIITDNPSLIQIDGLQGLASLEGILKIENNASLINISGLSQVSTVSSVGDAGRSAGVSIMNNPSLQNIDGLSSLNLVKAEYASLVIDNNPLITDVDGLISLENIEGGYSGGIRISNNSALTNVNGLTTLKTIAGVPTNTYLGILNNPALTDGGCVLFPILKAGVGGNFCPGTPQCGTVAISGNGPGFTYEEIIAEGPCSDREPETQPTNIVFTNVTDASINVSFTPTTELVGGYLVLMKAFGPPAPEDIPVDSMSYSVGDVIGSSSIVVYNGTGSSFLVTELLADTPYYFDVFSYNFGNDYLTVSPLQGSKRTLTEETGDPAPGLSFSNVTTNSLTVSVGARATGEYVALMKALSPPEPGDFPANGYTYRVGQVLGGNSIVVHTGSDSVFEVSGLLPNTVYYFDVFNFYSDSYSYDSIPAQGNQATLEEMTLTTRLSSPYPNPFNERTTIPFYVNADSEEIQISIFDHLGGRVADLAKGNFASGYHEASWDGLDGQGKKVKEGIYLYRIVSGGGTAVQGRLMLK
jgi:hypothetical protein